MMLLNPYRFSAGGGGGGGLIYYRWTFSAYGSNQIEVAEIELFDAPGEVDICNGGVITASAENLPFFPKSNAFNGDASAWNAGSASTAWIQYALPAAANAISYALTASETPSRMPRNWTLSASINGVDFTQIDARSGVEWSISQRQAFTLP